MKAGNPSSIKLTYATSAFGAEFQTTFFYSKDFAEDLAVWQVLRVDE